MRVGDVIAEIMKRERVKVLFVYPLTPLTEFAAAADIRPIVVRQERVACAHGRCRRAPELGRRRQGVCLPGRPGHRERVRRRGAGLLRGRAAGGHRPGGRRARWHNVPPNFSATLNFQHITKSAETVTTPEMIVPALRRAFTLARNGRPGPCLVEVCDVPTCEIPSKCRGAELDYEPTRRMLIAPDPQGDRRRGRGAAQGEDAADLRGAGRPLREGVARAQAGRRAARGAGRRRAWKGRARFPRTHALSLGAGRQHACRARWRRTSPSPTSSSASA